MPFCGGTPEAIANAIAKGRATRPTVTPAMTSRLSALKEYPSRRHWTSLGVGITPHTQHGAGRDWRGYITIFRYSICNASICDITRARRRLAGVQGRLFQGPGSPGAHPDPRVTGTRRPQRAGAAGGARPRAAGGLAAAQRAARQPDRHGAEGWQQRAV